ncbi:hypothetical protein IF650_17755 [Cellulosimicrobium terreum]|nr:hypothetical protein [Cellulosimicrobium terreum]
MRALSRRVPRRAVLRYALIALALLSVLMANIVLQRSDEADVAEGDVVVAATTSLDAPARLGP